jgi:hypothetical protein
VRDLTAPDDDHVPVLQSQADRVDGGAGTGGGVRFGGQRDLLGTDAGDRISRRRGTRVVVARM